MIGYLYLTRTIRVELNLIDSAIDSHSDTTLAVSECAPEVQD